MIRAINSETTMPDLLIAAVFAVLVLANAFSIRTAELPPEQAKSTFNIESLQTY